MMPPGWLEAHSDMTTRPEPTPDETERLYDELYDRYGRPREAEHTGAYVAISPQGETILGASVLEVVQAAKARFGTSSFVYKVGEQAVGKLTGTAIGVGPVVGIGVASR